VNAGAIPKPALPEPVPGIHVLETGMAAMNPRLSALGPHTVGRAKYSRPAAVMAGLVPAIHVPRRGSKEKPWITGTSPVMTTENRGFVATATRITERDCRGSPASCGSTSRLPREQINSKRASIIWHNGDYPGFYRICKYD
jgi:hypothetical protein